MSDVPQETLLARSFPSGATIHLRGCKRARRTVPWAWGRDDSEWVGKPWPRPCRFCLPELARLDAQMRRNAQSQSQSSRHDPPWPDPRYLTDRYLIGRIHCLARDALDDLQLLSHQRDDREARDKARATLKAIARLIQAGIAYLYMVFVS